MQHGIEVSAGVISAPDGRILICRRGEGRNNAHLWEFPGGKREMGESPEDCLVRELLEELKLPVTVTGRRCSREEDGILFHFINAQTAAQPTLTEHEDARFVTPRELPGYTFCPADVPVARRIAFEGVKHVIWDFDGTLVDTYPAMVRAFVKAAQDHRVTIAPARTLDLMKNCLQHCCDTVGAESGIAPEALRAAFRRHEQDELAAGTPLCEGIGEALTALHAAGMRHYVATHRNLQCRELLETCGVGSLFTGFVTQEDGLPRKPAPDMLLHLMSRYGLAPDECVMIGDRPLDTLAGRAAGMRSILIDTEGRFSDADADLRIPAAGMLRPLFTDP